MDTTALAIFVDVVRRGSFAAVARDRAVDPSAVSRAIQGLESDLGARLFQRTTRRLSLTEAGALYLEKVEPLLDELERAHLAIGEVTGSPRGTLRVSASVTFGQGRLVPLLPRFAAAYPDLAIDLHLADTTVDLVLDRFDVAIRHGHLPDSSLVASKLVGTRYAIYASPDYLRGAPPLAEPRDLSAHDCLRLPYPGFRTRWTFRAADGERIEVPVSGRVTITNAAALKSCAVAGMGPALLPRWLVTGEMQDGSLVDLFPSYEVAATDFDTAIWFMHPSHAHVPLKVRVYRDFLKRELRKLG